MDKLLSMTVFSLVAEGSSFVAAARRLRISPAMASKHILHLESNLGVRLLNRTTRKVSLTDAGLTYFERCQPILKELEEAEAITSRFAAAPRGTLKINAPHSFGILHLTNVIGVYAARYPAVSFEINLSDRTVDLVEEGFDLAVRIGRLADSSLVARRLSPVRIVACASPGYLALAGYPVTPADLTHHACIAYSQAREPWRFTGPGGMQATTVTARIRVDDGEAARRLALSGGGITAQPSFIVGEDLKNGRLRCVLPDFPMPVLSLSVVYPSRRHLSSKVRAFVDLMVETFGPEPYWDDWMPAKPF